MMEAKTTPQVVAACMKNSWSPESTDQFELDPPTPPVQMDLGVT